MNRFARLRAPGPNKRRRSLFLAAAFLLVAGCGGRRASDDFLARADVDPMVLEVDNRHWADMTISIRRSGTVSRLGLVTTNGRRSFTIPPVVGAAGASVVFLADPVGSGAVYESPVVSLGRGDRYLWTLAVQIEQSTLVRR